MDQWRDFSEGLSKVKRSMAPLQNVAGSLRTLLNAQIPPEQFNGFVKGFLKDLVRREADASTRIASSFAASFSPKSVVTISFSSTVIKALLALPIDVKISVAESLPIGEGARTCRELIEAGKEAVLFRDSMILGEVDDADLVLVGADGICPEGVVNKVGTGPLALAARERGRPFVVVCSTSKLIPVLDMDPLKSTVAEGGVQLREAVFEMVPLDLVGVVMTDEGTFTGNEMKERLLRDRREMKVTECQSC